MKNKISPEEKLLNILENPPPQKRTLSSKSKQAQSIKNIGSWFKDLSKNIENSFGLRMFNKVLAVICIFFTFFFIFDSFKIRANFRRHFKKVTEEFGAFKKEKKSHFLKAEIKEVLAEVRKRNIFTYLPSKVEKKVATVDTSKMVKNLRLVGIIWSDNPQAMIENTQEKKTYLVGRGEMIGELKIKNISKDKVTLEKEGLEWEIR